jgi:hypothetical protein
MTLRSPEADASLTPEQAADVIGYYHRGENAKSRERGWKPRVSVGLAAIHATSLKHSISPDGVPLLSPPELAAGIDKAVDTITPPSPTSDDDREPDWREVQFKDN